MRNHCTTTPDFIAESINHCCLTHDNDYVAQVISKTEADTRFYNCLLDTIDPISATIIYVCASIGGVWFWYRRKLKRKLNA